MSKMNMRKAYGEALLELGRENKKIVALEADLGKSTMSNMFGAEFPRSDRNFGLVSAYEKNGGRKSHCCSRSRSTRPQRGQNIHDVPSPPVSRSGEDVFQFHSGHSAYQWYPNMDPNAGMLRLVMGLGTKAVDRTTSDYPRLANLDNRSHSQF